MPDIVFKTLLLKARALLGPYAGAVFVCLAIGWGAHGAVTGNAQMAKDIARLDTTSVKKEDFRTLQRDVRETKAFAESTANLVRRLICRQYPRDTACT